MSTYRDDLQAAHLRVESLETDLEDEQLRVQSLRGELDNARQEKFVDLEGLAARVHRLEHELEVLRRDPDVAPQPAAAGEAKPGPQAQAPRKGRRVAAAIIAGLGALIVAAGLATFLVLRFTGTSTVSIPFMFASK